MKSRRQFVKQGAFTAAALVIARPFKALAGTSGLFAPYNNNHLVFLHTHNASIAAVGNTAVYMQDIVSKSDSTLLLHAGGQEANNFRFDVQASAIGQNGDYKIVQKGKIKTGIISLAADEKNAAEKVNEMAAMLKNEMNCEMVVCISQLGFKNKNADDDMKLAEASANVDLIIGGHSTNFTNHTMVVKNSKKQAVIVQSSKNEDRDCAKIEFSFDDAGMKRHIHIGTRLYKHAVTA